MAGEDLTWNARVAEIARKPLYRVTGGDVGIDPTAVERVSHRP